MGRIAIGLGLLVLAVLSVSVAMAATGGPDAGGYTWVDSTQTDGPVFSYVPLAAGDIGSSCDDCVIANVPIGFTFTFYGQAFTLMNISSNGNIQFGTTNAVFGNSAIPSTQFGRAIAPFWDDLMTSCAVTDRILVQTTGVAPSRLTTIEWQMTPHFFCSNQSGGGEITFQAVLLESSNHILFLYPDTIFGGPSASLDSGASATVGIQRDSTTGLQYSINTPSVPNFRAICFRPAGVATVNSCSNAPLNTPTVTPTGTTVPAPTATAIPTSVPKIQAPPPHLGAFLGSTSGSERNLANAGIQVPGATSGAAGQAAAQQASAAQAAAAQAAAAQAAAGLIRPPSTGDAGLADTSGGSWAFVLAGALVFALAGVASVKFARR